MDHERLKSEIQSVFDAWMGYFKANDFAGLRTLWLDADDPYYVAEEHETVMSNWQEISAYWAATAAINNGFVGEVHTLNVKSLTPTDVLCQFELFWEMSLENWSRPLGGKNRGMAGLRWVNDSWKIHSYMEAPLAPITYVRQLGASKATLEEVRNLYMDFAEQQTFPVPRTDKP